MIEDQAAPCLGRNSICPPLEFKGLSTGSATVASELILNLFDGLALKPRSASAASAIPSRAGSSRMKNRCPASANEMSRLERWTFNQFSRHAVAERRGTEITHASGSSKSVELDTCTIVSSPRKRWTATYHQPYRYQAVRGRLGNRTTSRRRICGPRDLTLVTLPS